MGKINDLSLIDKITLAVDCQSYQTVFAKQGDSKSRYIEFTLVKNGVEMALSATTSAIFRATKNDGTQVLNSTWIENNKVYAEITAQTLAKVGLTQCDIVLYDNGSILSSSTFFIDTAQTPCDESRIVSTDEYVAVIEALGRVNDIYTSEVTRTENETLRKASENSRMLAETSRVTAETKRVEANNQAKNGETLRVAAENTRIIAENVRVQNNTEVKELIDSFVGSTVIATTTIPGCVKSGGDISVSSTGIMSLTDMIKLEILKADNPIGTVRQFTVSTNPTILLGFGTWQQVSKGRVMAGVDTADNDFNTVGKQGGKKTIDLSHVHAQTLRFSSNYAPGNGLEYTNGATVATDTFYTAVGGATNANVLQPYECFYIWKRTA